MGKKVNAVSEAAGILQRDLGRLEPSKLGISEYNQMYLGIKLSSLPSIMQCNARIVSDVLSGASLRSCCFVEYGGGTGLLALLAKKAGTGTVVYNDNYSVSCRDARTIAGAVGAEANHYVEGDIDDLVRFCGEHCLKADAIVSQDVLEHIYDIEGFLSKLHLISHKGTRMVHTSGANMFSPSQTKALTATHLLVEKENRKKEWGQKPPDCLFAFSEVRAGMVKSHAPTLSEGEVQELTTRTRGLRKDGILRCVDKYLETWEYPAPIGHPTNTCDPYTGNWAERLINPHYLAEVLSHKGFSAKVVPESRPRGRGIVAGAYARILNLATSVGGLYLASHYSLHAEYSGVFSDSEYKREMYPRMHLLAKAAASLVLKALAALEYTTAMLLRTGTLLVAKRERL